MTSSTPLGGLSATAAQPREGFQEGLTKVTLGEVGSILSSEVTRLSRNGAAWDPRLEICGYRRGLMADRDGGDDPASPNGRLLRGWKGQLSARARQTIRARLSAGLLHKAERGDCALPRPVGLRREALNRVQKAPNRAAQHRVEGLCTIFLPRHSARNVLRLFTDHE